MCAESQGRRREKCARVVLTAVDRVGLQFAWVIEANISGVSSVWSPRFSQSPSRIECGVVECTGSPSGRQTRESSGKPTDLPSDSSLILCCPVAWNRDHHAFLDRPDRTLPDPTKIRYGGNGQAVRVVLTRLLRWTKCREMDQVLLVICSASPL